MDGLGKVLNSVTSRIGQRTQAGPPPGSGDTAPDKAPADQLELSPKAKRMQAINNRVLELIHGDASEEYRPMKMQDVLNAVRGQ